MDNLLNKSECCHALSQLSANLIGLVLSQTSLFCEYLVFASGKQRVQFANI